MEGWRRDVDVVVLVDCFSVGQSTEVRKRVLTGRLMTWACGIYIGCRQQTGGYEIHDGSVSLRNDIRGASVGWPAAEAYVRGMTYAELLLQFTLPPLHNPFHS